MGVDLGGECGGDVGFEGGGRGAWSQESMEGLRAQAARSAAAARARGGVCRWAAQSGCAGSAAPSARAVTRVRRASWGPVPWSGMTGWVAVRMRGVTASGPPAGRGPSRRWAPSWSAVRTVSMRGRRAAGPVVDPARGGVGMVAGPSGAHGWTCQLVRVFVGAAAEPGDLNSKGGHGKEGWPLPGVSVVWGWRRTGVCPASPRVRGGRRARVVPVLSCGRLWVSGQRARPARGAGRRSGRSACGAGPG